MDRFGYFQSQFVNSYSDGASDGSCALENYSSGDSTHSGEFPSNYQPLASPSSTSEGADVFSGTHDCSFPSVYQIMNCNTTGNSDRDNRQPRLLRNVSVSSPSPQQVQFNVAPYLHFSPPWQLEGWNRTEEIPERSSSDHYSPPHRCCSRVQFQQPELHQPEDPFEVLEAGHHGVSNPLPFRPGGPPRPRLSTCDDPKCELMKNGRDVVMDGLDYLRIRLRDRWQRQSLATSNELERLRVQEPSLKRRLAQIRVMIREELAERAAADEARGFYGSRRRERNGKKCKFCLKKNEQADIVAHHNLFDANGDVICPILQQYRCDVCHATGKQAHTIKYCPYNNPDTPHDLILQARYKVYARNKRETFPA